VLTPVIVITHRFAAEIIVVIYSVEFSPAILPFQILIVTLGFHMVDQILAHTLVARDYQNLSLRSLISATVVNIILNLILIPRYSYIGASVSTLVSMAVLTLTHHYFVRKYLYRLSIAKLLAIVISSALITEIFVKASGEWLGALLPLYGLAYAVLVVYSKRIVSNDEKTRSLVEGIESAAELE
jgi:O-antigen/teichoic acid export membrane protein